jgi:cytochrome c biogenesis protein
VVTGTIIPQGESPEYYFQNYSDGKPVLGFLTWQWVLGLSFDHIYTAPYFLGLLLLLAFSLVACTSSRQLPMVKVARRWSFLKSEKAILQMDVTDTLPHARVEDIGTLLSAQGYEVFARGPSLYAFKGLAGRLAPIGVHAALLLIMAGGTLSAIGGYHGTVMVPQGLDFQLSDALRPMGILSMPSDVLNNNVHVDKFYIDYRPTGEVGQFHSDLSIVNLDNQTVFSNSISVNSPLKYKGVTIYQSDWAISAVQVRVDGSEPYNLVMAPLQKGDNKLYGTFLPLGEDGVTKAKGM